MKRQPVIGRAEFAKRRRRLMDAMGEGGIAIVPAAPMRMRNRDVEHPYRQDSDFQYLTGFPEPEAVAVLAPGREHGEFVLFNRERNPAAETWVGPRAGQQGACEIFGADDSFPTADIDDILPGILETRSRVYYAMGCNPEFDRRILGWVNLLRQKARSGVHVPGEFIALDHVLHDMRLYKSGAEIKAMRLAAQASVAAHRRAMELCRPGLTEYQVEAELLHAFMHHGCRWPAYPPIVAGGANACILHYTENAAVLHKGELLLIDAAAEHECYAADITRTFPVSGTYTRPQRALYELVLAAQAAAIAQVRPGKHWNAPHEAAIETLTEGLVSLGLLKGRVNQLIKKEAYREFYMHRTGHWLGMDVHDVGDYKLEGEWRVLEPGMTLTVEPGLYVRAGTAGVAKKWWNIGIRIEDDVLVGKDGPVVLTADLPKHPDQIEALMQAAH